MVEVEAGTGPGAFPWRKRDRGLSRSAGDMLTPTMTLFCP